MPRPSTRFQEKFSLKFAAQRSRPKANDAYGAWADRRVAVKRDPLLLVDEKGKIKKGGTASSRMACPGSARRVKS